MDGEAFRVGFDPNEVCMYGWFEGRGMHVWMEKQAPLREIDNKTETCDKEKSALTC